jgi:hypothetical protein
MTLQIPDINVYEKEFKNEYENEFDKIKSDLKVFDALLVGWKIGRDTTTKKLYADPPDTFQSLRRWWAAENRIRTLVHLDDSFKAFMRLLDKILIHARLNGLKARMKNLTTEICSFINSILAGLNSLKFTYPQDAEIHCKIGSIILTLIDFKDDIRRVNRIHGKKGRKRSNSFEI